MVLLLAMTVNVNATDVKTLSWAKVCSGKMEAAWYGSDEAKGIADIVLEVQKETGGWMKNDQLHKLSASDLARLKAERNEHSCLDNTATTQEMRFLAKVYQATKVEKYRTAFNKALNMIFASVKACGGWSQYWPLSGNGSYQDYITFNDDLITNVLKILRDIHNNKGDFADIVDEQTRERCMTSFDKTIEMIIKCQIDDNGTKAAWCAQHDTIDLLPTEGRPHELPSVSGSESANLLSFLMTIEKPSEELQTAITAAVTWLGNHKIEGKAIEEFVNANGQRDRRIIDKPGSAIWDVSSNWAVPAERKSMTSSSRSYETVGKNVLTNTMARTTPIRNMRWLPRHTRSQRLTNPFSPYIATNIHICTIVSSITMTTLTRSSTAKDCQLPLR